MTIPSIKRAKTASISGISADFCFIYYMVCVKMIYSTEYIYILYFCKSICLAKRSCSGLCMYTRHIGIFFYVYILVSTGT
jgi:hypothetical protein